ncbi:MAG TPA: HAD family phosphatase [Methylomirabilota bacterium]|jgi:HAD superfamily hydrolase (TIGR01509 family)|nr:HAD family phosphatase [Methylomirabilota bacterium]
MTRACIFDMDGVLIDSGAHHRSAWSALLEELGVTPAQHEFWRLTIGRPAEEAVPLLLGRRVTGAEARRLALRKRALYSGFAARGLQSVPGAQDFVEALVRDEVPRAVATSASRSDVDTLLVDVGLRRYFDVVVTAEDVRFGKPDPQVYLEAARRIGEEPAACVVFEDSLVGVQAARRAGMRAIGVTTAHTADELRAVGAEATIADFQGVEWNSVVQR